jgi:hypothetical protein
MDKKLKELATELTKKIKTQDDLGKLTCFFK